MSTGRTTRPRSRGPVNSPHRGSATRYGTSGVVNHALHDYAKHAIPWLAWVMTAVTGITLNTFASTAWSLIGTVVLLLMSTFGVTWSVWMTCADRPAMSRWHGAATTLFGGLWLVMCTVTGFVTIADPSAPEWDFEVHGPTIGIWAICGLALIASWHTRINARDRATEIAEYLASHNPDPTPMDHAGLPGATWQLRRVNEFCSEGTLLLAPGQTYDDVVKHLEDLASAHELPPGSIKAYQPKGTLNARRVRVHVTHRNPIADPIPWPGLSVKVGAR